MARHRHDRPGAVLHQHVVGDEHRQRLAVDRVDHVPSERHARLRSLGLAAVVRGLGQRVRDVVVHGLLVLGARGEPEHVRVLGREHEEGRAEQGVRAGGEDRVVGLELLAAEHDLGPVRAADPVALHRDDVVGPVDVAQVLEQAVGVLRDPEQPLLELAGLDERAAALAVAVDDLLVGQDGLIVRTPLDRGLLAVGEAALEELEEDPLGPAVVAGLVRAELARPVDRDPPLPELALERGDRARGRLPRVLARLDRVVLGGQPERVVAHRVQDPRAVAAPEVGDRVADRVGLEMPHVRLAARVGQHLQHVRRRPLVRLVRDLPGALALPDRLPARLDRARVVAALAHEVAEVIDEARTPPPAWDRPYARVRAQR